MAQRCDVCGKGPAVGHRISHAHNVTKRRWLANLVSMRARVKGKVERLQGLHALPQGRQGRQGRLTFRAEKGTGGVATPRRAL